MKQDIEIAREAALAPIAAVGAKLGIPEEALHSYGRAIAKIDDSFLAGLAGKPDGKLILVTAISRRRQAKARRRPRSVSATRSRASASAPRSACASLRSGRASA